MSELLWSDKLLIGVSSIDDEHKRLISLFNKLSQATGNNDTNGVRDVFIELREYTSIHFKNEEDYMEEIGYDNLARHKVKHFELKSWLNDLQKDIDGNSCINNSDVLYFMRHWLLSHILQADMDIKRFKLQSTD